MEHSISPLVPNPQFAEPATPERVATTAAALERRGMIAVVAEDAPAARAAVLARLPDGAEVFTARSRSLDDLGLTEAIDSSGRYELVRARMAGLNPATNRRALRKLGAAPDVVVGSVHAITEAGEVLIASFGGSQLGPYAYSAGQVIWVVGSQKLVRDVDEALRRIREYSLPLEDARLRATYGRGSEIGKILLVTLEPQPGRITVVLVPAVLGF